MTSLLSWIADITLGPSCPHQCGHRARGHRARGHRTLNDHLDACPRRPR